MKKLFIFDVTCALSIDQDSYFTYDAQYSFYSWLKHTGDGRVRRGPWWHDTKRSRERPNVRERQRKTDGEEGSGWSAGGGKSKDGDEAEAGLGYH